MNKNKDLKDVAIEALSSIYDISSIVELLRYLEIQIDINTSSCKKRRELIKLIDQYDLLINVLENSSKNVEKQLDILFKSV